jgi:Domain of unknown function (DUF4282)
MEEHPMANLPSQPVSPSAATKPSGGWRDYVEFRAFITPTIMTFVWVLGAALITLAAVLIMLNGQSAVIYGFLYFLLGNVGWRIVVEVLVVVFSIHDTLREIANK